MAPACGVCGTEMIRTTDNVGWACPRDCTDYVPDPVTPEDGWAVTQVAHPALRDVRPTCGECLALTTSAVSTARVTGSVGSTYSDGDHSATVQRTIAYVGAGLL